MYQTRNALNYLRSQYQAIFTKAKILGMAVKYAIPLLFFVPISCIPPAFAENSYKYYAESVADSIELSAFAPLNNANSSVTLLSNSLANLTQDTDLSQTPGQDLMLTGNAASTEGAYQFIQINLNDDKTEFNFYDDNLTITGGAASKDGNFLMLSGSTDGRISGINNLKIQASASEGLLVQAPDQAFLEVEINSIDLKQGLLKVGRDSADPRSNGALALTISTLSMDDGLVDITAGSGVEDSLQGAVDLNIEDMTMSGGAFKIAGGDGQSSLLGGAANAWIDFLGLCGNAELSLQGGDAAALKGGDSNVFINSLYMEGGSVRLEGGAGSSSDPLRYGGSAVLTLSFYGEVNSGNIELKHSEQSNGESGAAKLVIDRNASLTLNKGANILNHGTISVKSKGELQITTQDQLSGVLSGTLALDGGKFDASSLLEQIEIKKDQLNNITGNGSIVFNDLAWNEADYSKQNLNLETSRLHAGQDGVFTVRDGQLKIHNFLDILGENSSGAQDKLVVTGGSVNFDDNSSEDIGSFDVASQVTDGINILGTNWTFANVTVSAPHAINVGDNLTTATLSITEGIDSNSETGSITVTNNSTLDLAQSLDIRITQGGDGSPVVDVGKAANSINLQQGGLLKINVSQTTADGSTPVDFETEYVDSLLQALVTDSSYVDKSQLYLTGSSDPDLANLVNQGSGSWYEVYEVTQGVSFDELKNFDLLYDGEEEQIYGNFGSVTSVSGKSVIVDDDHTLILNGNNRDEFLVAYYVGDTLEKTAGDILLGSSRYGSGGGAILTLNGDGYIRDILEGSIHSVPNTVNISGDVQGRNIGSPEKPLIVNYVAGSHSTFENVYAQYLNSEAGSVAEITERLETIEADVSGELSAKYLYGSELEYSSFTSKAGSKVNAQEIRQFDRMNIEGELSAESVVADSFTTTASSKVNVQGDIDSSQVIIGGELSAKSLYASERTSDFLMLTINAGSKVNIQESIEYEDVDISGELSTKSLTAKRLSTMPGAKVNVQEDLVTNYAVIGGEVSAGTFKGDTVQIGGNVPLTGALYVDNLDTSQSSYVSVECFNSPDWTQHTAILAANNLTGTAASQDMVLGTDLFVGQNSATFIGLDKAGADAALAKVKSNLGNLKTKWSPDGVGSMLYLNKAISLAPNKHIYLTTELRDANEPVITSLNIGGPVIAKAAAAPMSAAAAPAAAAAASPAPAAAPAPAPAPAAPSEPGTLTLNQNTALVISKNAVDTAKDNNAKGAVINFQDQATIDVQTNSRVILDGAFRSGDTALIFTDPDSKLILTGAGLQDSKIFASTLNGVLEGYIGEDGMIVLKLVDDVEEYINVPDPWYEEIIKILEEDPRENPSEGVKFIEKVATKGDGSELEVISALPAFSGVVQASLFASQSSISALTERLWSSRDMSNMSMAGNGMGSNMWLMPFYQNFQSQDMSANGMPYGVDMDMSGISLGYDFSIKDWFTIGGFLNKGGGSSDGKQTAEGVASDYDYYSLGLYGGYCFEKWGFFTSFAYSEVSSDAEAGFGFANINSSLESTCYDIVLAGKYRWDFESFSVTPHLELHYTNLNIDGYDVKNKANNAVISSSSSASANMLAVPVGVQFDTVYQFDDWTIKPSLDLTVVFNVGDNEIENMVTLSGLDDLPVPNQTEVLDDRSYSAHAAVVVQKGWLNLNFAVDYTKSENTGGLKFGASASLAF